MVELASWHGFALATKRGIALTTTPLVCIVQHDLAFRRHVDLGPIAELLLSPQQAVNYVCQSLLVNSL